MMLLTDEEIRIARAKAYEEGQLYGDDGEPLPEKGIAKAQARKFLAELKRVKVEHPYSLEWEYGDLIKQMEAELK